MTWIAKGEDIPKGKGLKDLNLGVSLGTDKFPVNVINQITGETSVHQMSLVHNGPFGFTLHLQVSLGKENAGHTANLYRYNPTTKKLDFQAEVTISAKGAALFPFDHASEYAIVIGEKKSNPNTGAWDNPFTDVKESDWFYEDVALCYVKGLMAGTSATAFSPDADTTRCMIVTILYRMEKEPAVKEASPFTDAADGKFFTDGVLWAVENHIVGGYGNGLFGLEDQITREQLASIPTITPGTRAMMFPLEWKRISSPTRTLPKCPSGRSLPCSGPAAQASPPRL